MEAKKIVETRALVRQASAVLRGHLQNSPQSALSGEERKSLRSLLQLLQPSLAIVRSFEQQAHRRCVYRTVGNAVEQVLSCAALSDGDNTHTDAPASGGEVPVTSATAATKKPPAAAAAIGAVESTGGRREGETCAEHALPTSPDVNLRWCDLYGCADAILALRQATTLPLQYPALFTGPRRPWRRLLLYGPPGTGKTQLAATAAAEFAAPLLSVSAVDLLSKWVGESEKHVRHAFAQAAATPPRCVLFFDEIDALCGARGGSGESELARRLKTEFLLHLQNVAVNVVVVAATNLPWELDAAIVRRFDRFIYVGLPSAADKMRFLRREMSTVAHTVRDEQLRDVVEKTAFFSMVDVRRLLSYAVMAPVTEWLDKHTAFSPDRKAEDVSDPLLKDSSTEPDSCDLDHSPRRNRINKAKRIAKGCDLEVLGEGRSELPDSHEEGVAMVHTTSPCVSLVKVNQRADSAESLLKAESEETIVPPVEMRHFEEALLRVVATTSAADLARYTSWSANPS